jgi:protease secretion system outer membrane protein
MLNYQILNLKRTKIMLSNLTPINAIKKTIICAAGLLAAAYWPNVMALDMMSDYQKATNYDPTYMTALADRRANQATANQAWTAYTPTASYTTQRIATQTSPTGTFTVSQPLFDLAALSSLRESEPKRAFAEATLLAKQQDLALRLLKAADAIILVNENLKLNNAKIVALEQEYSAAKRKFQLGQGTITDQRDIEVKAAQARSLQVSLKGQLDVAARQYAAITGETPTVAEFVLPAKHGNFPLMSTEDYVDLALQNNPNVLVSRYSERIAELEVQKSYGGFMPSVSLALQDVKSGGVDNRSVYTAVTVPLQAGTYFAIQGVSANYQKAREATRDIEEKVKVDVRKLRSQIETGFESLDIQLDGIKAAELSVEANIKSYEGGVRTTVDVLNATQTVYQVKSDYVTSVTAQAENYMGLLLDSTLDSQAALQSVTKFLFGQK